MDLATLAGTLIRLGAPVIGTALGGPAGAAVAPMILEAVTGALGLSKDATPAQIETAAKANPAALPSIDVKAGPDVLAELNARLADVQDARATTVKLVEAGSGIAWGAPVVSVLVMIGFCLLSYLAITTPASGNRDVILFLLGAWQGLATVVVSFWVGSSSASKGKDETIRQMASAPSPKVK